jgi:hypothetical protein
VNGGSPSDIWLYDRPLAGLNGDTDQFPSILLLQPQNWFKTLNSGSWVTQDGHPAMARLSTAATTNSQTWGILSKDGGTTGWLPFQVTTAGDMLRARIQVKVDSVANSQVIFGFTGNAAPWNAGAINTVNGAYWRSSAGGAMTAELVKASTRTAATAGPAGTFTAMADATWMTLGILLNKDTHAVQYYLNDQLVLSQTTLTNMPLTSTQLSLVLGVNPQTNAIRTLDYRRPYAVQEAA